MKISLKEIEGIRISDGIGDKIWVRLTISKLKRGNFVTGQLELGWLP